MSHRLLKSDNRMSIAAPSSPGGNRCGNKHGPGVPMFLQRKQDSRGSAHSSSLSRAINGARNAGSRLPTTHKPRFESGLGADFSRVRIHDGPEHNRLAKSLKAKAFTVGSDIYFAENRYRPGTADGDRLLAHELTHVLQQSEGRVQAKPNNSGLSIGESGDRYEREADRVAEGMTSGASTTPLYMSNGIYSSSASIPDAAGSVLQRDDDDEGFDYSVIPPSLAYRSGAFGLSADTSAAQMSYFSDEGRTSLGYEYGGDLFYDARLGGFRSRFGVNPGSGVASASFGGSHEGFNFGVGGNTGGNFNLSLGYGASLLPMPYMLGQQADAAWQGAYALGGAVPDFMADPIGAYGAHGENIGSIGTFGGSVADIYGQQGAGGLPFGAGLTLSYNPEQQWVFGAGVQGSF